MFDIPRVTEVKTTLLKESRRIAERRDAGVIDRDARNIPLRPLSNESINKCLALLSRILDDAVERGYLRQPRPPGQNGCATTVPGGLSSSRMRSARRSRPPTGSTGAPLGKPTRRSQSPDCADSV